MILHSCLMLGKRGLLHQRNVTLNNLAFRYLLYLFIFLITHFSNNCTLFC